MRPTSFFIFHDVNAKLHSLAGDLHMPKIYICLWSNDKAEDMAKFYKSVFKGTKIGKTSYWGPNPMGVKEGSVLTMDITVLGQKIMLLNGFTKMPSTSLSPLSCHAKPSARSTPTGKHSSEVAASPCNAAG